MSPPEDQELECADCGARFWFRTGEQRFFAERGLPDAPRRCPACRQRRKEIARRGPVERRPPTPDPRTTQASCAWCGGVARLPRTTQPHRPIACEACYRWRLGFGSSLVER